MKLGVKYCGGCNPHYERSGIVDRLRRDFPELEIVRAGVEQVDLVAVVCGCPVACATHEELQARLGKIVMTRPEDYEVLCRLLSSPEQNR